MTITQRSNEETSYLADTIFQYRRIHAFDTDTYIYKSVYLLKRKERKRKKKGRKRKPEKKKGKNEKKEEEEG